MNLGPELGQVLGSPLCINRFRVLDYTQLLVVHYSTKGTGSHTKTFIYIKHKSVLPP